MANEAEQSAIDSLIGEMSGGETKKKAPKEKAEKEKVDEEGAESPETETEEKEEPESDDKEDESPEGEEGDEDEEETGDEEEDSIDYKKLYKESQAQISELAKDLYSRPQQNDKEETIGEKVKFAFKTEDDFHKAILSKEGLESAINEAISIAAENTKKDIPSIVGRESQKIAAFREIADSFYTANPDLVSHKPLVGALMTKIAGENPSLGVKEVLAMVAKKSRKLAGLGKGSEMKVKKPVPKTGNTRPEKGIPKSKLEKELADLFVGADYTPLSR